MILVIPTAGLATRILPLSNGLPKVLVSHHDKPVFQHILGCYRNLNITKVILVISPQHRELFEPLIKLYSIKYKIELVVQQIPKGLLDAVIVGLGKKRSMEPVVVHLSDSIFDQSFQPTDFAKSFVSVARVQTDQVRHWCMVHAIGNQAVDFVDNPSNCNWELALTGVYYFSDSQKLDQALDVVKKDPIALEESNISALLLQYSRNVPLSINDLVGWWDMGTLSHLHQQQFCHDFDGHQVKQHRGQITKSGSTLAIKNEVFYYQHTLVPQCFPRLDRLRNSSITMQYLASNSLAYWFLWQPMLDTTRNYIADELWCWMSDHFYQHAPASQSEFLVHTAHMYGLRIVKRVEDWMLQLPIKDMTGLFQSSLLINGLSYIGWAHLKDIILLKAVQLANNAVIKHIHGDLHCANVLYDPERHLFTCLDPRGAWGNQQSIWGDIRYDAAKFLQSFHGSYEYIKNRLSLFEERPDGSYILQTPNSSMLSTKWLDTFCTRWSVAQTDVLWIEGLCLLSISKFYQDKALQKQFFLQGLLLLNSLL